MDTPVLNSWKEIAAYLRRGRRTVQRWERELQLPVRRPHGRSRSAVIAIPQELDAWLVRSPANNGENGTASPSQRKENCHRLAAATDELRRRTQLLQRNAQLVQARTIALIARMETSQAGIDLRRKKKANSLALETASTGGGTLPGNRAR